MFPELLSAAAWALALALLGVAGGWRGAAAGIALTAVVLCVLVPPWGGAPVVHHDDCDPSCGIGNAGVAILLMLAAAVVAIAGAVLGWLLRRRRGGARRRA
jgi:hypothetical protein